MYVEKSVDNNFEIVGTGERKNVLDTTFKNNKACNDRKMKVVVNESDIVLENK